VLDWAASGAMALTGLPDGPMSTSPAAALAVLGRVAETLAQVTGETGLAVRADPAELIAGRAALAGFTRGGQVSAGGSSFLLRAADGWCAVTLSRPDDLASVPAIGGVLGVDVGQLSGADPGDHGPAGSGWGGRGPDRSGSVDWARRVLTRVALDVPVADLAAAAQLLGVPAAALPRVSPSVPPPGPASQARACSARRSDQARPGSAVADGKDRCRFQ